MKRLCLKILFVLDVAAIAIGSVLSMFLTKYDSVTGIVTDGFGRVLIKTPWFLRRYVQAEMWAGIGWFAVDTVCFWVLVAVACIVYARLKDTKK